MDSSASIKCPVCGATISYEDLPALEEDIGLVAVDHGDHIVVVKYDANGFIRDFSVYPTGVDNVGKTSEKCPVCGREILVPLVNDYPSEFLYNHGDHVVVLYMFDTDLYTVNSIPLVKAESLMKKTFITKLIRMIGVDRLSMILTHVVLRDVEKVHAPKESILLIKNLFEELNIHDIEIEPGEIDFLPADFYIFFKKIIENNMSNPDVLIDKIKSGIQLVEKISELILSMKKKLIYIDALKDLMDVLKRKKLYLIVIRKLQLMGVKDVEAVLETL
ncbi:MAG: hypothetical protein ACP6IP_10120 [Candidatus Njordarchaeia archaeon]